MKNLAVTAVIFVGMLFSSSHAFAQYKSKDVQEGNMSDETQLLLNEADSSDVPVIITLEQALEIALSENVAVKVADMEVKRTEYAKKGSYAALYPQIDLTGAYQRTIKKQVMYMDFDMSSLSGMMGGGAGTGDDASGTDPGTGTIPGTDPGTGTTPSVPSESESTSSMADGMK